MIQTVMIMIICIYHSLLRLIGHALGLVLAGLYVGFKAGVDDVNGMFRYLKLHAAMAEKRNKERKEGKKSGKESD